MSHFTNRLLHILQRVMHRVQTRILQPIRFLRHTLYGLFVLVLMMTETVDAAPSSESERVARTDALELATFERKASLAKRLGATHVTVTDGLPVAAWQLQPPGDPYPAWFIQRPDFLKLYPPSELEAHVDMDYGKRVAGLIEERCRILRRLQLKAHWGSNLPQVLPESFFTENPWLRGPRVDQPNRSRTARFSPCVDQPETRRLYAESLKRLLERCPEIESFSFLTQDSGSGFCWAPSLYPGTNGHSACEHRPMSDRITTFLVELKEAASEIGHDIQIDLNPITPRQWMIPTFSPAQLDAIVANLPRGIAVQGREGPDGRPYERLGSSSAYARGAFYPVVGLAIPDMSWLQGKRSAPPAGDDTEQSDRRLISLKPDEAIMEFNARVYEATKESAHANVAERMASLRRFAVGEVGEAQADTLLEAWLMLDDADRRLDALNFGDMLQFGHVLNRWITRPMVPFPSELSNEEKAHYRPYLFQAKGEEQAENLIDIQAMRMYEGYGAHLLFQRVIETTLPKVEGALERVARISRETHDQDQQALWKAFAARLDAVTCLLRSADNMVAYQAQLDRVRRLAVEPEANPPLGVQSSWDRTAMMNLARKEIDNTVRLMRILEDASEPILDLALIPEEETIMRLGPDIQAQLKRKVDVMNDHWMDYDRLFTPPNP